MIIIIEIRNIQHTVEYIKLTWNPYPSQIFCSLWNDCLCERPLLIYLDVLTIRTDLSLPDRSEATAAEDKVCFLLNFLSLSAKTGCIVLCLPRSQLANRKRYPLSKTFVNGNGDSSIKATLSLKSETLLKLKYTTLFLIHCITHMTCP